MLKRLLRAMLATSLLLLSGCVVYSINPISPLAGGELDQPLLGNWQHYADGNPTQDYLVFETHAQGIIGYLLEKRDKEIDIEHLLAHTSIVADQRILNVRLPSDPHPNLYIFARYQVTANALSYSILQVDPVRTDIKAGTVAGTTNNLVLFTANKRQLQKYLASTDHFEKETTELRRAPSLPASYQKALAAYKAQL